MVMTRERVGREPETDVRIDRSSPPSAPETSSGSFLEGSLSTGWVRLVAVAWVGFFVALPAVEPASAEPAAAPPAYAVVLSTALLGLLAATAVGLVARRRWALAASAGAGLVVGGMAVACPASGHHAFGVWWLGELALVAAVLGVSLIGLRRA